MMLQCWHHEPHSRPTFAQLCSILEDIRPEQVRAVSSAIRDTQPGYLPHDVGHVMTVLDKNLDGPDTWRGVLDHNGHVGLFHPSKTVAFFGQAPKSSSFAKNLDFFNSSKLSKKRLSRELISTPQASRLEDNSDMVPLISSVPITPTKPANRMGHTIGYIRDKSSTSTFGVPVQDAKHEYHCIDDKENDDEDDLFKPLDLGPSMLDEVLSEIGGTGQDKKTDTKKEQLKDIVSNTLHMRRHKKKQLATVKPIKASDEKALESAIAMANALASKSMHDIDKRSDFDSSPLDSPSKKFSFFFPSSNPNHQKSSPKAERRSFLSKKKLPEISDQERNAYKELVGECESLPPLTKLGAPISQSIACFPTSWSSPEHQDHFLQISPPPGPAPEVPTMLDNNPLPLPPRNHTLNRSNPPKRHVRKNPLIVPSAMVSNMLRNEETVEKRKEHVPHIDNAFDHVLEQSIDALDNIGDEGGEEALFLDQQGAMAASGSPRKDADCDEVRIMMKVLGRCANAGDCFNALHMTQWDMHHAIKFVKLKNLIKANVSNEDMLTRLHIENWDVAKAASSIMKNLQ